MTAPSRTTRARKALTVKPKATGAGVAGSVTVIVVYCLQSIWNITAPVEVTAAITALVSWVGAYLAPESGA